MFNKTVKELSSGLANGEFSSVEITQKYLDRIKKYDSKINSFISVTEESALQEAKAADLLIAEGKAGIWTGIPLAHKDIFCTQGIKTTCGSKMLDNFISPYDATLVTNFKQAGAVCLGKTNMDEFAMGSSNETSYFGKVINPWSTNVDLVPGGVIRWFSRLGSSWTCAYCYSNGYRWFNSSASIILRLNRFKAYLWPRFTLWNDCFCFEP